jgi:hypothetical protein
LSIVYWQIKRISIVQGPSLVARCRSRVSVLISSFRTCKRNADKNLKEGVYGIKYIQIYTTLPSRQKVDFETTLECDLRGREENTIIESVALRPSGGGYPPIDGGLGSILRRRRKCQKNREQQRKKQGYTNFPTVTEQGSRVGGLENKILIPRFERSRPSVARVASYLT